MAHKLKVKRVPYKRRDGSLSPSKHQYIVRCKCRGKVCLESERFNTRREADTVAAVHWQTVRARRHYTPFPKRVAPVQYGIPVDPSQVKFTFDVDVSDATEKLAAAQEAVAGVKTA